ncbi:hypothetical protein FXW78_19210 [Rhodococcus opacus]|nr:hypothetical protein [Rhodococcus opacus]
MPAGNLDAYELANGLTVTMTDPMKEWDIQYRGPNDTVIDLHLTALMDPLMSHDTAVPGGHDFSHFHAVKDLAKDSVGHIDQTLQSTGSVHVGGQTFDFDFPSNRDHSWSPRPEYGHGRGNFDEAYFGSDMLFHMQTIEKTPGSQSLTNGYLIDHGELVLFNAGEARVKSADDYRISEIEYEIEDDRGRTHVLTGRPLVTSVFPTWPNQYNLAGVVNWTYESEKGLGEYKWHWEVSDMIASDAISREKY